MHDPQPIWDTMGWNRRSGCGGHDVVADEKRRERESDVENR